LWDFKKAFENVRRDVLLAAARRFSYPAWWLRLSLASYNWPRILTVEHAGAQPMVLRIGIAAGAMSATFELHLYMLGMLHAHAQAFPHVGLTLHVDDLIRDFRGPPDNILEQATCSNQMIQAHLHDLGMPLSADKEQVVATQSHLAQRLSRISLGGGRMADHTVRRLGVDYALSSTKPARRNPVRGRRFQQLRQRMAYMKRQFRRSRSLTGKVFYGGALPAATFGMELHGLTSGQLKNLMQGARQTAPLRQMGVPTDLLLFQFSVYQRPDYLDVAAPLLRYCRELWQCHCTALSVATIWQEAWSRPATTVSATPPVRVGRLAFSE
jgi:hypothetical protein